MCDLDAMYREEGPSDIDDECLCLLVKANRLLYDKKCKDYKNAEMKKNAWTAISSGCGASSGDDAERRWNQLRNQFGRKLRESKEKIPNGSGGGVKNVQWPLMGPMSFLLPHIENRRKRGSLTPSPSESRPATPSSDCSSMKSTRNLWDSCSEILLEQGIDDSGEGMETASVGPSTVEETSEAAPTWFLLRKLRALFHQLMFSKRGKGREA